MKRAHTSKFGNANTSTISSHRSVKLKTRAALGFKAFHCAHATLQGVEVVQMIRKGQVRPVSEGSFIDQFNSLAA
jgi:transposase-like protein